MSNDLPKNLSCSLPNIIGSLMHEQTKKDISETAKIDGDDLYVNTLSHLELLPTILDVEPNKIYNVFYNQLYGRKGTVYFEKVQGRTKAIWFPHYSSNISRKDA